MTDIFASAPQPQPVRLERFLQSVQRVVHDNALWVACFTHPYLIKSTRLEIRQDLLDDWTTTRYSSTRMSRKSFTSLKDACNLALHWSDLLEKHDMLKTIESAAASLRESSILKHSPFSFGDIEPAWIQDSIDEFTLHNDWVDLATCLSMSADEYVDANWRRFNDWLAASRQKPYSDREVFAFGMAVWQAYRQGALI